MSRVWVKICGIRNAGDAIVAFDAGADAVGLNFVPSSPRRVNEAEARAIISGVPRPGEWVGVFADAPPDEVLHLYRSLGLSRVQLHGHEPPEVVDDLLRSGVPAYQAVRIGDAADVELAKTFRGDRLLVDAKVAGHLGGTGRRVDPSLVAQLAAERPLILAGGLDADNVKALVQLIHPFGVDTASGVEEAPGRKDPEKVRAFVRAARG
jgi:phosphoribosylanthranilate isomerase